MWFIDRRRAVFSLIIILMELFMNSHSLPINNLLTPQLKDSIYNHLIQGQNLVIHENSGVVFSRVGYYYEVDDVFGLTVTVPVTQYLCSILPMEQVDKLSLCRSYQESLLIRINQKNISTHSPLTDFLNSTNHTRFSAEKVSIDTHHRSKRLIPVLIAAATGAIGLLFIGGISVYNSVKTALLTNRISEIQKSVSETNHQLHSLEVSVLTNTNTSVQLARSFDKAQENMEVMRGNMETIVKHVSRLDAFAEAQTRFNLKNHAEHIYERMKNSIRRIERNDLNLDFIGMTEQNDILEMAYSYLKNSVPSNSESKSTFVARMLFAQTVQFLPSEKTQFTNDTTGYYPEYLGNIVFTSFFSILKTNTLDTMQIYKLTALPFFIAEKEIGMELFSLPKMIGISNNGYMEWQEITQQRECDFGDYTVCRDPPVLQKRINNMCLEQLISTNRTFHCRARESAYSSPHVQKLSSDVMALSTRTPINCSTSRGFHVLRNLSIVQLGCNDTFFCDNNINFVGDKRCRVLMAYVMKTAEEQVVPVVELIRPLNISLPKIYPFATDKNLILTLEEQMRDQKKNIRETEKTGDKLSELANLSATRPLVITLTVALGILALLVIIVVVFLFCRCHPRLFTSPTSIVNIGAATTKPIQPTSLPTQDNMGSLHDLLTAFTKNKQQKKTMHEFPPSL